MTRGTLFYSVFAVTVLLAILATLVFAFEIPKEIQSPYDRISEDQIHIYPDKIVVDIEGASWAEYADTNSMDPVLDFGANGLEIIPKGEDDLYIADIAAYESKITGDLIIHRIVDIKQDSEGKYFIFRGDNNRSNDPEKIRFSQIKYVLIGIIY